MRYFFVLFLTTNLGAAVLSNDQISCTITEDGIQSISLAGREVTAQHALQYRVHQGFYNNLGIPPAPGTVAVGPVLHSVLTSTPASVTISDTCSNMTMTYTYSLDDTDIQMEAVLKNSDPLPFSKIMIELPAFVFGPDVSGNLTSWDSSYLAANWEKTLHPSTWVPLAVSYARDGNYGLALHCKSHFGKRSLFNAYQFSGHSGIPPTVAAITLYIGDYVPPGGRLVVDVTIHLTAKTDLASVLSSYVRDFQNFAPAMQYLPDDRPWIYFASIDASYVTAQNPLGYNGNSRRFDLPGGIQAFEDMVWPSVGVTQGTIFWQPQGYNRRGCQYRPDFDVWPDSVSANLPKLIAWYRSNGLKFGLCARPAEIVTPASPTSDQTCELDGDNASQMAMLLARFDAVAKLGVNAFYLDSFGTDINSYHIMKQLRAHLGNAVPTYTEFTSDLMLPYSGVYTELNPGGAGDRGTRWYNSDTLKIFRLLYPHSGILTTKFAGGSDRIPVSPSQFEAWKLTPMVEDYSAREYTEFFQDLIANHMNGNVWK
jgi:hypothetical protein